MQQDVLGSMLLLVRLSISFVDSSHVFFFSVCLRFAPSNAHDVGSRRNLAGRSGCLFVFGSRRGGLLTIELLCVAVLVAC